MRKRIFLSAGGTGGHIFPAISLIESNKKNDYYFLLDKRTENIIKKKNLRYFKIQSSKIKFNFLLPIYFSKILVGLFQSIIIFLKYKPELVIGFGGYTSIPSIIAARILKIKILIHEQNAVMGRTNRLLSYLTKNIAITFENTLYARKKSYHTGIPVRKNNFIRKKSNSIKTILVIGGSQGARAFSTIVPKLISHFSEENKKKIFLIQQTRKSDMERVTGSYNQMKIKFVVEEFLDNIYEQYNSSDLIISRCGASTLAEIELFKKFAILFPLPGSMSNHQYFNALEFKKNNNCVILDEKKINFIKEAKKIEKKIFLEKNSYKLEKNIMVQTKLSLSTLVHKLLEE